MPYVIFNDINGQIQVGCNVSKLPNSANWNGGREGLNQADQIRVRNNKGALYAKEGAKDDFVANFGINNTPIYRA